METEGKLEGVRAYTIHGSPYYQLYFTQSDDPETIRQCQLPADAVYENPRAGDLITITKLLQTIMRVDLRT